MSEKNPIKDVVLCKNGGRLLIFFTGKTKYLPSKKYIELKERFKVKPKFNFKRQSTVRESCDKFFIKIFGEDMFKEDKSNSVKNVSTNAQGRAKKS